MRDFNDPQYKKWRIRVFKRDGFACKKCGSKNKIQAHHIRTWEKYPQLRFDINNGITLCKLCHQAIWQREEEVAEYFLSLIGKRVQHNDRLYQILNNMRKKRKK